MGPGAGLRDLFRAFYTSYFLYKYNMATFEAIVEYSPEPWGG